MAPKTRKITGYFEKTAAPFRDAKELPPESSSSYGDDSDGFVASDHSVELESGAESLEELDAAVAKSTKRKLVRPKKDEEDDDDAVEIVSPPQKKAKSKVSTPAVVNVISDSDSDSDGSNQPEEAIKSPRGAFSSPKKQKSRSATASASRLRRKSRSLSPEVAELVAQTLEEFDEKQRSVPVPLEDSRPSKWEFAGNYNAYGKSFRLVDRNDLAPRFKKGRTRGLVREDVGSDDDAQSGDEDLEDFIADDDEILEDEESSDGSGSSSGSESEESSAKRRKSKSKSKSKAKEEKKAKPAKGKGKEKAGSAKKSSQKRKRESSSSESEASDSASSSGHRLARKPSKPAKPAKPAPRSSGKKKTPAKDVYDLDSSSDSDLIPPDKILTAKTKSKDKGKGPAVLKKKDQSLPPKKKLVRHKPKDESEEVDEDEVVNLDESDEVEEETPRRRLIRHKHGDEDEE